MFIFSSALVQRQYPGSSLERYLKSELSPSILAHRFLDLRLLHMSTLGSKDAGTEDAYLFCQLTCFY